MSRELRECWIVYDHERERATVKDVHPGLILPGQTFVHYVAKSSVEQAIADAEQRGREAERAASYAAKRLLELESALAYLCDEKDALVTAEEGNGDAYCTCTEAASLVEMARHFGWPGIEPSKQGAADE